MAYSFGGGTGETAESLKRKRAYVQALLESAMGGGSNTVGEGISTIGRALAGRLGKASLDKKEREGRSAALGEAGRNPEIRKLLLGDTGGGGGADISGTGGANTLSGSAGRDRMGAIDPDLAGRADYIRQAAARIGVDPEIAVRVARSEGLAKGVWQSNYHKNGKRETSYGPYQLLIGGGLGDKFMRETGLDPRDPSTERAQVDFALKEAKAGGWSPWYGAAKVGVGKWDGLRGNNAIQGGGGQDNLGGSAGNDTFNDPVQMAGLSVGTPDRRAGYGLDARTNKPISSPIGAPPAGREYFSGTQLPQMPAPNGPTPAGREYFAGNAASGGMMQQPMPQQAPQPQPRPQMAPQQPMQPDPMQTAAIQQQMRPRGIVSPRAEDNGYTRGPGAAPQNMMPGQGGQQGGGLLARLLMRQPMPQGGGQAPQAAPQGNPQAAPQQGDDMMRMYALLDDPYLPEGYRNAIMEALKQKQAQSDPAYQADLAYRQAQIRALENPEVEPGYRVLSEAEEKEMGLDPAGSYQIGGKDNKVDRIGGNGVTINTGEVKLPAGYRPIDPSNPGAGVEPIPGGPAEAISAETAARLGMAEGFIQNYPAIEKAVKEGGLTGLVDQGMASVGRGQPGELQRQIKSGTDALQRMLTGAGMPASEAAQYAGRYQPGWLDDAETALSKLKQLKYDLEHAGEVVGRGRGGSPINTPAGGTEDPLGIR